MRHHTEGPVYDFLPTFDSIANTGLSCVPFPRQAYSEFFSDSRLFNAPVEVCFAKNCVAAFETKETRVRVIISWPVLDRRHGTFAYAKMQQNEPCSFWSEKLKKIWGGAPNYTGFARKTGSWTVKKIPSRMHQNSPYWEPKSEFFFWGGGTAPSPTPSPVGREHPLPTPHFPWRLRRLDPRACGARPWRLRRLVLPHLCSCKLTL